MKFIQVDQFGGPEQLQLREEPTPAPQAGQLLIEVQASGVGFADTLVREGSFPLGSSLPYRPGTEVAGTVIGMGAGVSNFRLGQRVMAMVPGGGYASHVLIEAQAAISLPDTLDFAPATALLEQGLTAYFLLQAGQLQPGSTVLVPSAAGGVGSLAVQIAKLKGAGKVIGLASPAKHAKVRAYGADAVFDYTQPGWSKQVLDATQGQGVNLYLDSQGNPDGEGARTLGKGAFWVVFGGQAVGAVGGGALDARAFIGRLIFNGITMRGYTLRLDMHRLGEALPELLGWAASGQLNIEVNSRFPLANAAQAHAAIAARQTSGKVVLEP